MVHNFQRDGQSTIKSQGGAPNYYPNTFNGPENDPRARALYLSVPLSAHTQRVDNGLEDNFSQARLLWTKVEYSVLVMPVWWYKLGFRYWKKGSDKEPSITWWTGSKGPIASLQNELYRISIKSTLLWGRDYVTGFSYSSILTRKSNCNRSWNNCSWTFLLYINYK